MAFAVAFLVVAAYLAGLAASVGGWGWVLLWPAVAFAVVAAGYAGAGPRVFGKRPDGTLAPARRLLMLPFLLFMMLVWHLLRLFDRGPVWNEVTPGLFVGRRVFARELSPDIGLVIDLTAEFAEPRAVRVGRAYRSLPILDAGVADEWRFRTVVAEAAVFPGLVYVHYAQGYGRSGLFASAILIARGLARTPAEAVTQVQKARPGVRLKTAQRRFLKRVTAVL